VIKACGGCYGDCPDYECEITAGKTPVIKEDKRRFL